MRSVRGFCFSGCGNHLVVYLESLDMRLTSSSGTIVEAGLRVFFKDPILLLEDGQGNSFGADRLCLQTFKSFAVCESRVDMG